MGRVSESIKSLQSSTDHHSYHPHFRTQERQQQITDKVKMSEDKIDEGNIFTLSLFVYLFTNYILVKYKNVIKDDLLSYKCLL